jgi:uncharacterized protein
MVTKLLGLESIAQEKRSLDSLEIQLLQAIFQGELSLVRSLLAQGANPNIYGTISPRQVELNDRGNTPLMWAADEGFTSIAIALLDAGAKIDARNTANYTALMNLLLARGAAVDGRNACRETEFTIAARQGLTDILPNFLARGADIHATNYIGDTALYLAAENGHLYAVKLLIERGANVNTCNRGGWTPLMMVAARGDLELIELLLQHGADFTPQNNWGATALSEAQKSFRARQAVALLTAAGARE